MGPCLRNRRTPPGTLTALSSSLPAEPPATTSLLAQKLLCWCGAAACAGLGHGRPLPGIPTRPRPPPVQPGGGARPRRRALPTRSLRWLGWACRIVEPRGFLGQVGYPGDVGAITGYSSAGVAISEKVWLHYKGSYTFEGAPTTYVLRELLQVRSHKSTGAECFE